MLKDFGVPGGIRTPDLEVRSLAFYPAKLRALIGSIYTSYFTIIIANARLFKRKQKFFQKNIANPFFLCYII